MDIEINREDAQQQEEKQPECNEQTAAQEADLEGGETETEAKTETTVKDWAEALETAVRQRDEYLDIATRARADFENFRKRNANARAESYDDGNNDCIKAILPVLDNFERAISVAENNEDAQSMLSGVKMIQKQLMDALGKRGLEEVRPVGEKFDPNEHNAVLRVSADEAEGEPGTICEVLQTGYRVKGKMLRHPMVKVIED